MLHRPPPLVDNEILKRKKTFGLSLQSPLLHHNLHRHEKRPRSNWGEPRSSAMSRSVAEELNSGRTKLRQAYAKFNSVSL
ncbi:hypothetical protein V6N13_048388 [Hibiscus sabdariffa]|uniref:Uncharacterized protein n=1 Tax=Hibiscus sabdariffa TaxID=183260 RepID=A0ABR2F734_9ROSI